MSSLTGWKMAASFVFIAAIAVLFGYSGRSPDRGLLNPAAISLPLDPAPDAATSREAKPLSNEITDFQQLD
jgi:hypothetical protein